VDSHLLAFAVFYGMMIWGGHKDKKRQREMLNASRRTTAW